MSARQRPDGNYRASIVVAALPDRVFDSLTTVAGLAGWWTSEVSGSPALGRELRFAFGEEAVVMRVDRADRPTAVTWTCLRHTRFPEWQGTEIAFDVRPQGDGRTRLSIELVGLVPDLGDCYDHCSRGWDHFLGSIAGLAGGEGGSPWQSPTARPAPV